MKIPTDKELREHLQSQDGLVVQKHGAIARSPDSACVLCYVWVPYNDVPGYEDEDYGT